MISTSPDRGTAEPLDVLAYLISAARIQLDEAAEYAPLRLLTAARKLADHLAPRASAPVQALVSALDALPATATQVAWIEQNTALGRVLSSDERDEPLLFLVSDAAGVRDRPTTYVDGGRSCR